MLQASHKPKSENKLFIITGCLTGSVPKADIFGLKWAQNKSIIFEDVSSLQKSAIPVILFVL